LEKIESKREKKDVDSPKTGLPRDNVPRDNVPRDNVPREQYTDNKEKAVDNQSSWGEDNKTESPKQYNKGRQGQRNRDFDYKGQRSNQNRPPPKSKNQIGRGKFDLESDNDFPSLSGDSNIEITEPNWPHGGKQ